ncbi:hypothetical protein LX32DRAFT_123167 [Colletotrichum zoysiae]|uniref:Uncharacterized protein n=1 Tax=Colletotrichum zoysiae TaxID=1216348 RepID=A0AAD9LX19_9PEZI|nr:hypothetical protein LX32DRAFT_123167 [Colletotrichum zoysiae]
MRRGNRNTARKPPAAGEARLGVGMVGSREQKDSQHTLAIPHDPGRKSPALPRKGQAGGIFQRELSRRSCGLEGRRVASAISRLRKQPRYQHYRQYRRPYAPPPYLAYVSASCNSPLLLASLFRQHVQEAEHHHKVQVLPPRRDYSSTALAARMAIELTDRPLVVPSGGHQTTKDAIMQQSLGQKGRLRARGRTFQEASLPATHGGVTR